MITSCIHCSRECIYPVYVLKVSLFLPRDNFDIIGYTCLNAHLDRFQRNLKD